MASTGDVNSVIQAALGGAVATTVLEGDRQFNLAVRFPADCRDSVERIRNIKVAYPTSTGVNAYIPLSELAAISLDTGASWIYHESTHRFIPIKFSVRDRDLGSDRGRGAGTRGPPDQAAQRLSHGVVGRIRRPCRKPRSGWR